jgi:chromosome segregation ATPase
MVAGAGEVLSMFLGGRRRVRSLSGMSSRRSQTVRAQGRLRSATEKVDEQRGAIEDLEQDLADEIAEIWDRWKGVAAEVEEFEVPLERTDIGLDEMTLFWAPSA